MITLKNISKVYNPNKRNEYQALNGINLEISKGEMCAVIGESGSGKSTLLHIIGMLDNFSSGKYVFEGKEISELSESSRTSVRAKNIGFVKQDFALIDDYTAVDNVMLPLYPIKAKNRKKKALAAIDMLGISELAEKYVSELSGGEKQRVAIARAIVNKPSLILADEPTGSLDSKTSADILRIFKDLNAEGKTIVIVTHDKGIAEQCGRIIEIFDGAIV